MNNGTQIFYQQIFIICLGIFVRLKNFSIDMETLQLPEKGI